MSISEEYFQPKGSPDASSNNQGMLKNIQLGTLLQKVNNLQNKPAANAAIERFAKIVRRVMCAKTCKYNLCHILFSTIIVWSRGGSESEFSKLNRARALTESV